MAFSEREQQQIWERLSDLDAEVAGLQNRRDAGGGSNDSSGSPGSGIPIIDSEAGTAGSSSDWMRADTVHGIELQKNTPADEDVSALEFAAASVVPNPDVTAGFRIAIAEEVDSNMRAAASYGSGYATLEVQPDEGVQVRVSDTADNALTVDEGGLFVDDISGDIPDPYTSTPENVSTAGGAGSSDDYARGDHYHKLALVSDSPLTWVTGELDIDIGIGLENNAGQLIVDFADAGYDEPEDIALTAAVGTGEEVARDDHVHAIRLTGETNFLVDGNANEGKVYAVYKA